MQMARSTYYFELSKADQVAVRNHCLADEIKDIFSQHKGRYGVRRVYQELIKRGHKVNHKRVQRLMHTMGLAGCKYSCRMRNPEREGLKDLKRLEMA